MSLFIMGIVVIGRIRTLLGRIVSYESSSKWDRKQLLEIRRYLIAERFVHGRCAQASLELNPEKCLMYVVLIISKANYYRAHLKA